MEHEKGTKTEGKEFFKRKKYRSHMAKSHRNFQTESSSVKERIWMLTG
jgi:hypothetical protein